MLTSITQFCFWGFRKVHLDRWEFANAGFLRGKKHLLKSIKRRNHVSNNHARMLQLERDTEFENLRKEQEALKVEIRDLKQQQQISDKRLAAIEERVKYAEWKHRQVVVLVAKLVRRSSSFQQLIDHYKQKKLLCTRDMCKKQRLTSSESLDDGFFLDQGKTQNVDQCHEDVVAFQSEMNLFLCSPPLDDLGADPIQYQKSSEASETSSQDLSSGNYLMWEKLMEDDVICEDDEKDEEFAADQCKFVHVLEDLIAKPPSLGSLTNVGEVVAP